MTRISRDEMFMSIAHILSARGTCNRARVGAVIVKGGRIISTGYVGAPAGLPHCTDVGCELGPTRGCERTVHAEANAIAFAARNGISTEGAAMYVTLAPCYTCAKLIINAGIKQLYYWEDYRDRRGLNLLQAAGVEVTYLTNFWGGFPLVEKLIKMLEETPES